MLARSPWPTEDKEMEAGAGLQGLQPGIWRQEIPVFIHFRSYAWSSVFNIKIPSHLHVQTVKEG